MKLALYLPNFRDKVTVEELADLTSLAEDLDRDLPEDHAAHALRLRAERHPHTDLARPLFDGVREHAVESHRREQRREHCERCRETR